MKDDPNPVEQLGVAIEEAQSAARDLYRATLHRVFTDSELDLLVVLTHRSALDLLKATNTLIEAAGLRGIDL